MRMRKSTTKTTSHAVYIHSIPTMVYLEGWSGSYFGVVITKTKILIIYCSTQSYFRPDFYL